MGLIKTKIRFKNNPICDLILYVLILIYYIGFCIDAIAKKAQPYYFILCILSFLIVTTFIFYYLYCYKKYLKINKNDKISIYHVLPRSSISYIFFTTFYNITVACIYSYVFSIAIFEQDYSAFFEPVNILNIVSFLITIICLIISILLIIKRKINKAVIYATLPSFTFSFITIIKIFC